MSNNNFIFYQAPNISHQAFFLQPSLLSPYDCCPLSDYCSENGEKLIKFKIVCVHLKNCFSIFSFPLVTKCSSLITWEALITRMANHKTYPKYGNFKTTQVFGQSAYQQPCSSLNPLVCNSQI